MADELSNYKFCAIDVESAVDLILKLVFTIYYLKTTLPDSFATLCNNWLSNLVSIY